LAWTSDDLDRVERNLALGYTEVTFADGRSIKYADLAGLLGLRNLIKSEMAAVAVSATVGGWPTHRRLARVSTGLASGGGDDAPAPWNRLYRWP
jgi:hypothetical protein